MSRTDRSALALGFICVLLCASVHAQQTYRCGKVFQDQPCDGNTQINSPAPSARGGAQNAATQTSDPACARRGEEAQKVVWAKEAGRTEEMQLAATTSSEQKRLISDVYRRRGTSTEMRAAIEGDCNAERDRAAQAAALIQAGRLLQQDTRTAAPAAPSGPTAEQQAASKRESVAAAEAAKQSRCKSLNARLEQERTGTADSERARRQAGC